MPSYLITGASRGLGWESLRQLSEDETNIVIGVVRDKTSTEQKALKELNGRSNITVLEADFKDYKALEQSVAATAQVTGGSLDYLIANAASLSEYDNYDPIGVLNRDPIVFEEELTRALHGNITCQIRLINLYIPLLLKDMEPVRDYDLAPFSIYAISKAGMNMAIAKFSAQYKQGGILFLSLSPGIADTGYHQNLTPYQLESMGKLAQKFAAYAPNFKGPSTHADAVRDVISVWENASIENRDGGAFLPHQTSRGSVMRFSASLAAAACYVGFANSIALPKAYFVQIATDSTDLTPSTLEEKAAELTIPIQLRQRFSDKTVFYGVSVALENDDDVEKLRAVPGVEKVFPVQQIEHKRPTIPEARTTTGRSTFRRNEPISVSKCASGAVDWNSPHAMTGVDQVHAEGILGEGVRVAILDTGIDYLHPALGGCFGKGCKVEFGYDLVGDDYGIVDYVLRPKPDPRPLCYNGFHGTHVAGIIGMEVPSNASMFAGLMGVAPRATLGMYRVFGCDDIFGGEDVVLAALEKAVEDGAHVVSMSFEVYPWPSGQYSPVATAVAALKSKGIAAIASAGNSGANGMFTIVLPGGADGTLSIASVENSKFPTYPITDSNGVEFRYGALYPFAKGEYPVAWASNDSNVEDSGCSASDYPAVDSLTQPISDYVVAVKKGVNCRLERIQALANAANYTRILTFTEPTRPESPAKDYALPPPALNSDGSEISFALTIDDTLSNAARIGSQSYKLFVRSQVPLLVEQPQGFSPNNYSGVASSIGPNLDFGFKPNLAGPGGSILSTYPLLQNSGGFGIISGTSMAAPFVSGVYALIKSHHPSLSIDEIFDLMKATAKPVNIPRTDTLSPTIQQGAGLVQAYDAMHATTRIHPAEISLVKSWEAQLSIHNPSNNECNYSLSAKSASGISAFAGGANRSDDPGFIPDGFEASVMFQDGPEVIVPAGGNRNVSFTVVAPQSMDPERNPIISGFININSSRGENFSIPYMGPAYSYSSAPVIGLKNLTAEQRANAREPGQDPLSAPQVFANSDGADIGNRRSFSFRWPDVLYARFSTLQPVRQFRMDIVRASTNFTPTWYGFDPSVKMTNLTETPMAENGTVGGVPVIGSANIQHGFRPRTNFEALWEGFTMDVTGNMGISLRKGSYRVLLRWLKYYEDADDPNAWDSWMSGVVDVTEDYLRGD
ncbi:peptidase [Paramyrothecium foliicola]|nr:peptidase [Paramyrothecium foliicola]